MPSLTHPNLQVHSRRKARVRRHHQEDWCKSAQESGLSNDVLPRVSCRRRALA